MPGASLIRLSQLLVIKTNWWAQIRKPIQVCKSDTNKNERSGVMKAITRRTFAGGIALLPSLRFSAASAQAGVTPPEARAIAKEAYVYGFPSGSRRGATQLENTEEAT